MPNHERHSKLTKKHLIQKISPTTDYNETIFPTTTLIGRRRVRGVGVSNRRFCRGLLSHFFVLRHHQQQQQKIRSVEGPHTCSERALIDTALMFSFLVFGRGRFMYGQSAIRQSTRTTLTCLCCYGRQWPLCCRIWRRCVCFPTVVAL